MTLATSTNLTGATARQFPPSRLGHHSHPTCQPGTRAATTQCALPHHHVTALAAARDLQQRPTSCSMHAPTRIATHHRLQQWQRQQWRYQPQRSHVAATAASAAAGGAAGALASVSLNVSGITIFPVSGPWGVWAALVFAAFAGLWCERNTRIGKELSGALMATLFGMVLANTGILPPSPPEVHAVYKFLLPLAIPMLLFAADLRRVIWDTGRLLPAFLLGSVATVAGTLVAMKLFSLSHHLGGDGWKIAAALTARHIGGAVNYMAVSEQLSIGPSVFGAGLAADDLMLTLYFTGLYALAKGIPPDAGQHGGGGGGPTPELEAKGIGVMEGLQALCISSFICFLSHAAATSSGAPGQLLTWATSLTLAAATLLPRVMAPLAGSAQGLAQILMQVFYATIGASANIPLVLRTAPVLFVFSLIALAVHLALLLGVGKLLGFSRRDLLLASNANIGGPSTVAGMAAAKGWNSSIIPSILTSTLGYAIGTFIGIALGKQVLRGM